MFELPARPLVSIVIHTYNRANFIIETIQSIQKQTYANWELVIIDDGSEDNTEELVIAMNDDRIKFIKAGRIGRTEKLKNVGFANCSGELIAFNDSDDLWSYSKLEKQVQALIAYPEAGFCMTGGYNFKINDEPLEYFYKEREGKKFGNFFISVFQSQLAAFTQTLLVRRQCIDSIRNSKESSNTTMNDSGFIINLCYHFKAILLYESLVFRRLHPNNHNNSAWIENYQAGIKNILTYKTQLPPKISNNALFKLYINFGEDYLIRKKKLKAISKFLTSWKYRPYSIVPIKKTGKALLRYLA